MPPFSDQSIITIIETDDDGEREEVATCTLAEFFEANEADEDWQNEVREALTHTGSYDGGGGAQPTYRLELRGQPQAKMMWKEAETQNMLPRCQRGVDYGRARPVLIQRGDRAVVVEPGHSAWNGVGQSWKHTPTVFVLATMSGDYRQKKDLFEGRMTKAKMAEARPRIAAWLGVGVEDLPVIKRRKTFIHDA